MKKKVGRPKKEIKKTTDIRLRVKETEKEIFLNKLMNSDYKNMSQMLFDVVINERYKIVTTDEKQFNINNQILGEVSRIGNNFNQFVKLLNQKKTDNFTKDDINKIIYLLNEINIIFNKIKDKKI